MLRMTVGMPLNDIYSISAGCVIVFICRSFTVADNLGFSVSQQTGPYIVVYLLSQLFGELQVIRL